MGFLGGGDALGIDFKLDLDIGFRMGLAEKHVAVLFLRGAERAKLGMAHIHLAFFEPCLAGSANALQAIGWQNDVLAPGSRKDVLVRTAVLFFFLVDFHFEADQARRENELVANRECPPDGCREIHEKIIDAVWATEHFFDFIEIEDNFRICIHIVEGRSVLDVNALLVRQIFLDDELDFFCLHQRHRDAVRRANLILA